MQECGGLYIAEAGRGVIHQEMSNTDIRTHTTQLILMEPPEAAKETAALQHFSPSEIPSTAFAVGQVIRVLLR
jgi:redox-sensitive bicupin YhaK (pirin superfamily)